MNEHSSRSHAIFLIFVECSEVNTGSVWDMWIEFSQLHDHARLQCMSHDSPHQDPWSNKNFLPSSIHKLAVPYLRHCYWLVVFNKWLFGDMQYTTRSMFFGLYLSKVEVILCPWSAWLMEWCGRNYEPHYTHIMIW